MKDIRTSQGSCNLVFSGDIHWSVESEAQNVPQCTQSSELHQGGSVPTSTVQLLPWSVGTDYLIISTQIRVSISEFYELIRHSFKTFLLIPYHFQSQASPPPSQLPTLWLTPMATVQFMTRLITFSSCLHFPCLLLCQIIVVFPELIFCQQTTPQNTHIPGPFCTERCWLLRNRWVGGE